MNNDFENTNNENVDQVAENVLQPSNNEEFANYSQPNFNYTQPPIAPQYQQPQEMQNGTQGYAPPTMQAYGQEQSQVNSTYNSGQPNYSQSYTGPTQNFPTANNNANQGGLAIASLIIGIVFGLLMFTPYRGWSILGAIVGLILSIIARKNGPSTVATVGLILNMLVISVFVVMVIFVILMFGLAASLWT